MPLAPFRDAGFFVLRTPLLPYDALFALGAPGGLAEAAAAPEVREALWVASPDLSGALAQWERGELGPASRRKVAHALYRYLARMAARSTPFGLFAGVSVGRVGRRTELRLGPRAAAQRITRPDCGWLVRLFDAIGADPGWREVAVYRPNSALCRAGGAVRYVETAVEPPAGALSHQLVRVSEDPGLDLVLAWAAEGATLGELAGRLVETCEVPREDADAYLFELVDAQLLVAEPALAVTGADPLTDASAQLARHPTLSAAFAEIQSAVGVLDALPPGVPPSAYEAVDGALSAAWDGIEPRLQVDLWKPLDGDTLGAGVVRAVHGAIRALHAVAPAARDTELEALREAFVARYGAAWVPLTVATDPELGVLADRTGLSHEATALLEGLTFDEPGIDDVLPEEAPLGARGVALLGLIDRAARSGAREIALTDDDLARLRVDDPVPLPMSFAALFQLGRGSEILLRAAVGAPASRLLGRFGHGSAALAAHLASLARAEAAAEPDVVLAELVHLPEGRSGNVVCRPAVRAWEIPYLGRGAATAERQLAVDDLWVAVEQGAFALRSRRHGFRVVPVLSCAHNPDRNTVPVYRFLARLQTQGCNPLLSWRWGALASAPHLPRVRLGDVIVARETWTLLAPDLAPLASRGAAHLRELRDALGLPRHVALAEGDNELPIDLDDPLAAEVLTERIRSRSRATLLELWPGPGGAGVDGPDGAYANEIVLPFVGTRVRRMAPLPPLSPPQRPPEATCWRITASQTAVDRVLSAVAGLAPGDWAFSAAPAGGPWTVELRLGGSDERVRAALEPLLADGRVRSWQIVPAEPADPVDVRDSEAALALLALVDGDETLRWQLALLSVHRLLTALAPVEERIAAVEVLRAARRRTVPLTDRIEAELSRTWQAHQDVVAEVLGAAPGDDGPLGEAAAVLAERDGALPAPAAPLAALAERAALRLLRAAAVAHELVIYDVLRRTWRAEAGRARYVGVAR